MIKCSPIANKLNYKYVFFFRQSQKSVKTYNISKMEDMYEEVGVRQEVKRSHDIQLAANEAYGGIGPIQRSNCQASSTAARYDEVKL